MNNFKEEQGRVIFNNEKFGYEETILDTKQVMAIKYLIKKYIDESHRQN